MEPLPNTGASRTLTDYTGLLRRQRLVIILAMVIGLALAAAYVLVAPKQYTATSAYLVTPTAGIDDVTTTGGRTSGSINLDTEAQLVKSEDVSVLAKIILQSPDSAPELAQRVTVTVPPNTTVMRISYEAGTAAAAQAGADAFANAYEQYRKYRAGKSLDSQVLRLTSQLSALTAELASSSSPSDRRDLTAQITATSTQLGPLKSAKPTPGKLITSAPLPAKPSSPNRVITLASGLMIGLLIGLLLAWRRERRDHRIHDAGEILDGLGLPVILEVAGRAAETPALVPVHTRQGQAYGQLRNALLSGLASRNGTIVVSGASSGEGACVTAVNLAVAFARAGRRTVLLVAEPSGTATAMLGLPQGPGLSDVIEYTSTIDTVRRPVDGVRDLEVIAPGARLDTEIDFLQSVRMADLVQSARAGAEILVILAPSTSESADAQALSRHAEGAVVVVEKRSTLREEVIDAFRQFDIVGTSVPGAVIVPRAGRLRASSSDASESKTGIAVLAGTRAVGSRPASTVPAAKGDVARQ